VIIWTCALLVQVFSMILEVGSKSLGLLCLIRCSRISISLDEPSDSTESTQPSWVSWWPTSSVTFTV